MAKRKIDISQIDVLTPLGLSNKSSLKSWIEQFESNESNEFSVWGLTVSFSTGRLANEFKQLTDQHKQFASYVFDRVITPAIEAGRAEKLKHESETKETGTHLTPEQLKEITDYQRSQKSLLTVEIAETKPIESAKSIPDEIETVAPEKPNKLPSWATGNKLAPPYDELHPNNKLSYWERWRTASEKNN